MDYLVFCKLSHWGISVYPLPHSSKHPLPLLSVSTDTNWPPIQALKHWRGSTPVPLWFVFQSLCMMMCLQSGKPSGQPNVSLLLTLSSSSPWRWWRSTGTSSWRTTWTSLTSLSSSMVRDAASYTALILHSKDQFTRHKEYDSACPNSCVMLSVALREISPSEQPKWCHQGYLGLIVETTKL